MKQIRKSTFETNSSSTHVISIQTENVLENSDSAVSDFRYYLRHLEYNKYSEILRVECKSFGWEHVKYFEPEDKLMYLLIALNNRENPTEDIERIKKILKDKLNVELELPDYTISKYDNKSINWIVEKTKNYTINAYIDHDDELVDFANYIMSDENILLNYLFGVKSTIETGNDNEASISWFRSSNLRKYKDFDDFFNNLDQEEIDGWGNTREESYERQKNYYSDFKDWNSYPEGVIEYLKDN